MSSLYPDQQLRRRAMAWALRLKVNPERVEIAEMPNKWGSCTSDGVVTFADELAETGEAFQDYVIVHELLHLRYPAHGKRFHAMMSAFVPNWRDLERQSRHSTESSGRGRRQMEPDQGKLGFLACRRDFNMRLPIVAGQPDG